jgi:DNA-binding NtrC family response regulator
MLIVEHDTVLRGTVVREAEARWGIAASAAATMGEALARLAEKPDLVVFALRLPDGSGLAIADQANSHSPVPRLIAMVDHASADEALALGRRGVRYFLSKPISLDELRAAVQRSIMPPPLGALAAGCVGVHSLHDVIAGVRQAMVERALARANGNRTMAAEMLGVTRQAVQQMIRDMASGIVDVDQRAERSREAQANLR